MIKEPCLQLVIVFVDILPKVQYAITIPGPCCPSAMCPWTHDEMVVIVRGLLFNGFVSSQGAKHIFRIKPPAHYQHCRTNVLQVRPDIPRLPVSVVGGM